MSARQRTIANCHGAAMADLASIAADMAFNAMQIRALETYQRKIAESNARMAAIMAGRIEENV